MPGGRPRLMAQCKRQLLPSHGARAAMAGKSKKARDSQEYTPLSVMDLDSDGDDDPRPDII